MTTTESVLVQPGSTALFCAKALILFTTIAFAPLVDMLTKWKCIILKRFSTYVVHTLRLSWTNQGPIWLEARLEFLLRFLCLFFHSPWVWLARDFSKCGLCLETCSWSCYWCWRTVTGVGQVSLTARAGWLRFRLAKWAGQTGAASILWVFM